MSSHEGKPTFWVKDQDPLLELRETASAGFDISSPVAKFRHYQRRYTHRQQFCFLVVAAVIVFGFISLRMSHGGVSSASSNSQSPNSISGHQAGLDKLNPQADMAPPATGPRRAMVIASYKGQDVGWLQQMEKSDWEIYRYVIDDPFAPLTVPNDRGGREAMVYTTFIIDNYDNLPDHIAFIHGHNTAWHQPEPIAWKLEALNRKLLDRDDYISFRCHNPPTARPDMLIQLDKPETLGPHEKLVPWFWKYTNISATVPTRLAFPCCAQFATTKAAIRRRSRQWWTNFRNPMLRKTSEFHQIPEEMKAFYEMAAWGFIYEKLWHVAFGKPAVFTPDSNYCFREQWSDAVHCDFYPTPPFPQNRKLLVPEWKCWKNDAKVKNFDYKVWSDCNRTDYKPVNGNPVWYSSDPGTQAKPRNEPCP